MAIKAIVFDAYGTLYDVRSVEDLTEAAFPGRGEFITHIWRMKQLEYTWLRSMMGRYEDFWTITKESLAFTLGALGLEADAELFDSVAEQYNNLDPFPDAKSALESLSHYRLAVLSNGSPAMLGALMRNTGFDRLIGATISVDARRVFKPDPRAYSLVEERLGLSPKEVLFVSSNGFDVSGAKIYGFNVVRIDRAMTLRGTVTESGAPQLFRLLRAQVENIGYRSDFVVGTLSDLSALASSDFAAEH